MNGLRVRAFGPNALAGSWQLAQETLPLADRPGSLNIARPSAASSSTPGRPPYARGAGSTASATAAPASSAATTDARAAGIASARAGRAPR